MGNSTNMNPKFCEILYKFGSEFLECHQIYQCFLQEFGNNWVLQEFTMKESTNPCVVKIC